MYVADYLLECVDPPSSARVSKSPQYSYTELGDAAARVEGGFLRLFYLSGIAEVVLNSLHGHQSARGAATRRLKGQFQFLLIRQSTARRGSAWRT